MFRRVRQAHVLLAIAAAIVAVTLAGCSAREGSSPGRLVRVGYFPNFTHAAPIVGLKKGFFQASLGRGVRIKQSTFVAGPELNTALLAGQLDVAYIGPGPAITAYSKARNVKIVAGSNNAGAVLVARTASRIKRVSDLRNKKVAVPLLGNTQDISLRGLLREAGLTPADRGGDVEIVAVAPADLALTFERGEVDAALVPEPWGTILVSQGKAAVVLDYKQVWANGDYPTTVLIATDEFARREPALLAKWIAAHRRTIVFLRDEPEQAAAILGGELKKLTGKEIPRAVLLPAYRKNIPTVTIEPRVLADFIALSRESGFLKVPVRVDQVLKQDGTRAQ